MERDFRHIEYQSHEQLSRELVAKNREADMLWAILGLTGLAILLVLRRKRRPAPVLSDPEMTHAERIEEAIRVLETPCQLYAGRWFKHTIKMVECDPPAAARPKPHIEEPSHRRAR